MVGAACVGAGTGVRMAAPAEMAPPPPGAAADTAGAPPRWHRGVTARPFDPSHTGARWRVCLSDLPLSNGVVLTAVLTAAPVTAAAERHLRMASPIKAVVEARCVKKRIGLECRSCSPGGGTDGAVGRAPDAAASCASVSLGGVPPNCHQLGTAAAHSGMRGTNGDGSWAT